MANCLVFEMVLRAISEQLSEANRKIPHILSSTLVIHTCVEF